MATTSMSRRHFELIAGTINALPDVERVLVAKLFADVLPSTNPNFDRQRFFEAETRKRK